MAVLSTGYRLVDGDLSSLRDVGLTTFLNVHCGCFICGSRFNFKPIHRHGPCANPLIGKIA